MPKPTTLEDVVGLLKPDRVAFAEVYDRERPNGSPDFKTIAVQRPRAPNESVEAAARQDMLAALRRADKDEWLNRFSLAATHHLVEQPGMVIALQAVTNPNVDFDHIGDVSEGVIKAMRRCCRIVCGDDDNPVKGSGFLVGPQLVLTNWHVVKAQIKAEAKATEEGKPVPPARDRVEFDAFRQRDGSVAAASVEKVADTWLVKSCADGLSGAEEAVEAVGLPRPLPEDKELLRTHIDFAVIELAEPVGYERGWYELSPALPTPAPEAQGQLVQFPGNFAMRVTAGAYLGDPAYPGRVSHAMNTIGGSSGGLCATTTYEPIALHQGALKLVQMEDAIAGDVMMGISNIAIPLGLIAEMAGEAIALRAHEAPTLLHQTQTPASLPIVGRHELQRAIHELIYGANRIIVVRSSYDSETGRLCSGMGKSFSVRILETMTQTADHVIRVVSSADLPAEPYAAARAIVAPFREVGMDPAVAGAFDRVNAAAPAGDSTRDADIRTLARDVVEALRGAAGETRTLWLVLDDLDKHAIDSSSPTANLLNQIYGAISAEARLRAMLIGPTADLPGLEALSARTEGPLGHLSDLDIERWIRLARGRDRPLPEEAVKILRNTALAILPGWRTSEPLSRTARLADILKTVVGPQFA